MAYQPIQPSLLQTLGASRQMGTPQDLKRQLGMALMQQVGQKSPDFSQVLGLAKQRQDAIRAAQEPAQTFVQPRSAGAAPGGAQDVEATGSTQGLSLGNVNLSPGADRAGARTGKAILHFVGQIAGLYGSPLTIGTGTNHNQNVAGTNRESAHWRGNAADIPASGATLTKLGQDALIAAGMSPAQARRVQGGLFNIGGYQVIFQTHEGGDHTNHLHVGIRR